MNEVNARCIHDFDIIIDVRSPSEFAHSHIPDAINMPVLDDMQRHLVGQCYRNNPFQARILGASLVCENISHLLKYISDVLHPSKKILIYCARGGQRSLALATILEAIGYRISRLKGGYKAYRNHVCEYLADDIHLYFIVLCGLTGSGKTEIIKAYTQSINLEYLAAHRGSSFGALECKQPSQKMFTNLLFSVLNRHSDYVVVEFESKRIGELVLPKSFVCAMQKGLKIEVVAPIEDRIKRIVDEYGGMDVKAFQRGMQKIKPYMKHDAWIEALHHFENAEMMLCAEILLVEYYDRVYRHSICDERIFHTNIENSLEQLTCIIKKYVTVH